MVLLSYLLLYSKQDTSVTRGIVCVCSKLHSKWCLLCSAFRGRTVPSVSHLTPWEGESWGAAEEAFLLSSEEQKITGKGQWGRWEANLPQKQHWLLSISPAQKELPACAPLLQLQGLGGFLSQGIRSLSPALSLAIGTSICWFLQQQRVCAELLWKHSPGAATPPGSHTHHTEPTTPQQNPQLQGKKGGN